MAELCAFCVAIIFTLNTVDAKLIMLSVLSIILCGISFLIAFVIEGHGHTHGTYIVEPTPLSDSSNIVTLMEIDKIDSIDQFMMFGALYSSHDWQHIGEHSYYHKGSFKTGLWIAISEGKIDIATKMLDNNVSVNIQNRDDKRTPIFWPIMNDDVDTFNFLRGYGADVAKEDKNMRKASSYATGKIHQILINSNDIPNDVNIVDLLGRVTAPARGHSVPL